MARQLIGNSLTSVVGCSLSDHVRVRHIVYVCFDGLGS
ncbi:hypothetical protein A2U01_0115721, partial [Trifolium medium]|nr:hypothetical protein [Trifolium medium]